jgi:hypothetical protein
MAAAITTTHSSAMMFAQLPLFRAGVEEKSVLYGRIKDKGNKGVVKDGSKYTIKGTVVYKNGFSTRMHTTEIATRPTYYPGATIVPEWTCKTWWSPFQLSGTVRDTGDLISMTSVESVEMQQVMDSVAWHLDAMVRCQDTFRLTTITAVSGSTITVTDAGALRVGQRIDSFLTAGTPKLDSATISKLNYDTNVATLAAAATNAEAGDSVAIEDTHGYNIGGLGDLVNDGSEYKHLDYVIVTADTAYAGITRADYAPLWSACIKKYGEGVFESKWISRFASDAGVHMGKMPGYTAIYAHPKTAAALWEGISVKERYMDDTNIRYGQAGDIEILSPLFANKMLKVVPIRDFWKHSLWFINENDLGIRYPKEYGWKNEDGKILHWNGNDATGYDQYTGSVMGTCQLIGHPNEHGILVGINDLDSQGS